jgi:hypothetical protein
MGWESTVVGYCAGKQGKETRAGGLLNVRFSSVFSVNFVGSLRETTSPKHSWPGWQPERESVSDNDRLRASNELNQRWAREGRPAVIIYQLSERDLYAGAMPRSQPYFYLDGDDYQSFKTLHDKEFPVHQQDELAADWNRGEWSKRFLRVCKALADRLVVQHDKQMRIEAPRWGKVVVLDDPSSTPMQPPEPLPNLAPVVTEVPVIAGTTVPNAALSTTSNGTEGMMQIKSESAPTAA